MKLRIINNNIANKSIRIIVLPQPKIVNRKKNIINENKLIVKNENKLIFDTIIHILNAGNM